jgi:hypothetical protein
MRGIATVLGTVLIAGTFASGCVDSTVPTAPALAVAGASSASAVRGPRFTTFQVPGASFTLPIDINENGVIVGRYAAAGSTHLGGIPTVRASLSRG